MNVELFPGAALSPKVLEAMQDSDDCQALITVKMDKEGLVDIAMSRMSIANMAFMTLKLQLHVAATVQCLPPEGTDLTAPETA